MNGKFEVEGDTVKIVFNKSLKGATDKAKKALVVKDSKGERLGLEDYKVTFTNDNKQINLQVVKKGFNDVVKISLSNNISIEDLEGNLANDFSEIESLGIIRVDVGVGVTGANETKGSDLEQHQVIELDLIDKMGSIDNSASGDINVRVGATNMPGNEKIVKVALETTDDTANAMASKIRTALNGDTDVNKFFTVSGNDSKITLTAKEYEVNDLNMGIRILADTVGPKIVKSTIWGQVITQGSKKVKHMLSTQISSASNSGDLLVSVLESDVSIADVTVTVKANDTPTQIADKIVEQLNKNASITSKYTVTRGSGQWDTNNDRVILEQLAGQESLVKLKLEVKTKQVTGDSDVVEDNTSNSSLASVIDTNNIQAISKNEIKMSALGGNSIESVNFEKIKFVKNGVSEEGLSVSKADISQDKNSVILTLNQELNADGSLNGDKISLYTQAEAITTTKQLKTEELALSSAVSIVDKIRPTIQGVNNKLEVTGDTAKIVFDKALKNVSGWGGSSANDAKEALVVTDNTGERLTSKDYSISITNGNKEIHVKMIKPGYDNIIKISLSDNVSIEDTKGNYVNDFTEIETVSSVRTAVGVKVGGTISGQSTKGFAVDQKQKFTLDLGGNTKDLNLEKITDEYIIKVRAFAKLMNDNKEVIVDVILSTQDNVSSIAEKIKTALGENTTISDFFTIEGKDSSVTLTAKEANANDTNMGIRILTGTEANAEDRVIKSLIFSNSEPKASGSVKTKEKIAQDVTGSLNSGDIIVSVVTGKSPNQTVIKEVTVTVGANDTAAQVAGKIVAALNNDETINVKYKAFVGTRNSEERLVILESLEPAEHTDLAFTIKDK